MWTHSMDAEEIYWEKVRLKLHKNATSYTEEVLVAISHETTFVWPPTSYL